MSFDDRTNEPLSTEAAPPLPNRFTRDTALGCLGLACVLAMPLLLFLPFLDARSPVWFRILAPFVAFLLVAVGIVALSRVPPSAPLESYDPHHPLTSAGTAPVMERPATAANRFAALQVALLGIVVLCGVAVAARSEARDPEMTLGVGLAGVAAIALIGEGVLMSLGRLALPALRWVRVPIQSRWAPRGAMLLLVGLAVLVWALLMLAQTGSPVGTIGFAVLIVTLVLGMLLARRVPPRVWQRRRSWPTPPPHNARR